MLGELATDAAGSHWFVSRARGTPSGRAGCRLRRRGLQRGNVKNKLRRIDSVWAFLSADEDGNELARVFLHLR
jgi:hypothetical protein